MSGRRSRQKGDRTERQLVARHKSMGIFAERVPLSGGAHYQGNSADLDVYPLGRDQAPFCCEVKARKSGAGFTTLERWLADNDVLFLKRDRADPLVVLPWASWEKLCRILARRA